MDRVLVVNRIGDNCWRVYPLNDDQLCTAESGTLEMTLGFFALGNGISLGIRMGCSSYTVTELGQHVLQNLGRYGLSVVFSGSPILNQEKFGQSATPAI